MMASRFRPLTRIQHAYLTGRRPETVLGGPSTHGYFEFITPVLDPTQLNRAIDRAVRRHEALRTIVHPDSAEVLDDVPEFPLAVHDLRNLPDGSARTRLANLREEQSSLVRPADQWPLFGITLVILDQESRVLLDVDGLTLDLASVHLLLAEITGMAQADAEPVPDPGQPASQRSISHWEGALQNLPPAPRVPLNRHPREIELTHFTSRAHLLTRERWEQAVAVGRRHGLTPSALALTLFAETLHQCTGQNSFSLMVPLNRRPRHRPAVIGSWSNFVPVGLDWSAGSLADRGRDAQRRLLVAMLHGDVAGPELVGSLMRMHHRTSGALLPVVFTSGIGIAPATPPESWRLADLRSQTAGIWLDGQVTEVPQGLMIHWDSVDEVLGADRADHLFALHVELWEGLVEDSLDLSLSTPRPDPWDARWEPLVTPSTALEQLLSTAWSTATGACPLGTHDDLLTAGANPSTAEVASKWLTSWFGAPLIPPSDLALASTITATAAELTRRRPELTRIAELSLIAASRSGESLAPSIPHLTPSTRTRRPQEGTS